MRSPNPEIITETPILGLLAEARSLLEGTPDLPKEIINAFIDTFQRGDKGLLIEALPALGTGEIRISLNGSDRLIELVAALRALNRDGCVEI
jgi:hypothetical protein